jgi:hypothetical protein
MAEGAVTLELSGLQKAVSALAGVLAKSDDAEFMSQLGRNRPQCDQGRCGSAFRIHL